MEPNNTNKALMQQQQHILSVKRDYTLNTQTTTANDNVDNQADLFIHFRYPAIGQSIRTAQ